MMSPEIINLDILKKENTQSIKTDFEKPSSFRFVVIDNFLNTHFAARLHDFFPTIESMKTHYAGLNERKAEDADFARLDKSFTDLHEALSKKEFIEWIESVTSTKSLSVVHDRLGHGLHQGGNHSFLDIHIDYNIHPLKKIIRRLNLIIFLNNDWKDEWGGHLEFWDSKVQNCLTKIKPDFNRCVIFECCEVSYHGYSKLELPPGVTRKSFYQYYFTPLEGSISFHDTIFKARPKESSVKKISTSVKEFIKNNAKKTLLKLGLDRFLK